MTLDWTGEGRKSSYRCFCLRAMELSTRRESGYEGARAALLASREFIEQSSVLTPHVPLLCHNSTTIRKYREGARVAECDR